MKKLLFVVAIVVMSATVSKAQEINFGAKAGLNVAFLTTNVESPDGSKPRIGYHAGAMVEIGLMDKFAIQPEVLYSTQGYVVSPDGTDAKSVNKFDYINIPIMAKIFLAEGLSLEVGPQIGFLMSAKTHFDDGNGNTEDVDIKKLYDETKKALGQAKAAGLVPSSVDIDDFFLNSTDIGVNVGFGYKISSLSLGARYCMGLTKLTSAIDLSASKLEPEFSRNGVFQLSVGYFF